MMHALLALTLIAAQSSACGSNADRAAISARIGSHSEPGDGGVYGITIVGNYAEASRSIDNGVGQANIVLAKRNGRWRILYSGGGAYMISDYVKYGVPVSVARTLSKEYNAQVCP